MDQLRYDGRVAVVTGAGNGLGKEYALLLASRGAKVVVNDLGCEREGIGNSNTFADQVVKQIIDSGGVAVADYNSVVEGEKIVKTAIDNFGRVDIVINNAGIIKYSKFSEISEKDWDLIQAVHMKGVFKTTQAAWEIFKKQKYGRVVMVSSIVGLLGFPDLAAYCAAKMGVIGLAHALSIEGAEYNIKINIIAPNAGTRLNANILSPDLFEAMKPNLIAPIVAYMVHESFEDTNNIVNAISGFASKTHCIYSEGTALREKPSDPVTIESVKQNWSKVVDMKDAKHIDNWDDFTHSFL